jgi:glycosyltransferase involved in cell wall biosynthesis
MTARKVLLVHSGASLYGSDRCLLAIACGLDTRRYVPVVALPREGPLLTELARHKVETHVLPIAVLRRIYAPSYACRLAGQMPISVRGLGRFMEARGVSLVHTNASSVLSSGPAARLRGLPHICHVREIPRLPRPVRRLCARFVSWESDRVIVDSRAVREQFLGDLVPDSKTRLIHDAINLESFRGLPPRAAAKSQIGMPPGGPLIGTVGRVTPWKGHRSFVEAAGLIAGRVPEANFVVVGDVDTRLNRRYRRQLEARAQELGLSQRMRFVGFREDVSVYLAAMDVFVLPSSAPEPFGRVVLEAMASGTPVVATAHGGPVEVLEGGRCGLLVPPNDERALAEAVERLLEDAELGARLAGEAMSRVQDFGVERHVQAVEAVYDELLGGADRPGATRSGRPG